MSPILRRSRRPLALAIALALGAGGADAATITVTNGGDPGTSATCTLRQAISTMKVANASGTSCSNSGGAFGTNDTILFDTSAVPSTSTVTLSGSSLSVAGLTAPLTIQGSGQSIDGNKHSVIFYAKAATLTINSLTLTGGYSGGYGGGVYAKNSSVVTLTNSAISGCRAFGNGGGLFANVSTVTLINSTVSGNYATQAGGVEALAATVHLVNSTISGNSARYTVGGLAALTLSTVTLTNSTVSGNSAGTVTGGVLGTNNSVVTLTNTILAGNTVLSVPADLSSTMSSVSATYSLLGTALNKAPYNSGHHNIFWDNPGLDALADNGGPTKTMALKDVSPALRAGSIALIPSGVQYDQRGAGYPRVVNGTVDIGAFESSLVIFANGFESGP